MYPCRKDTTTTTVLKRKIKLALYDKNKSLNENIIIKTAFASRSVPVPLYRAWLAISTKKVERTTKRSSRNGFTHEGKDDDGSWRRWSCRRNNHQPSRQFAIVRRYSVPLRSWMDSPFQILGQFRYLPLAELCYGSPIEFNDLIMWKIGTTTSLISCYCRLVNSLWSQETSFFLAFETKQWKNYCIGYSVFFLYIGEYSAG